MSEIRDFETWSKSLRNFSDWLGDCVPGASDIDCVIERRHNFLVMEGKTLGGNGIQVPVGQAIMLDSLASVPRFTVYLVGEGPQGGKHLIQWTPGLGQRAKGPRFIQKDWMRPKTNAQLQTLVREWWEEQ